MARVLTLAMIGCGGMAGAHLKGYRTLWEAGFRDIEITATCDIEIDRAERMADAVAEFQGRRPAVYGRVEELIAQKAGLDAVDICAVHRAHHSLAIACMQAGLHVTIEKPLAITLAAGRAMLAAADENGRILQVAENYRRSPFERAINWAIKTGRIGNVRMLFWVDVGERLWHWGWRDFLDQAGGGWTLDGGVHFADLFRYHIGDVETVYAVSRRYNPRRHVRGGGEPLEWVDITVEDTTMAVLSFEGNVTGTWALTGSAPGRAFQERAIYGDEGCLSWSAGLVSRQATTGKEELIESFYAEIGEEAKEQLFPRGITDTVALELKEFADAVLGRGELEVDGLEGYKAQAISMAVYESAHLGRPVALADVEAGRVAAYQAAIDADLGLVGAERA
ncbi:MAG TPA: Gfo/Idh/MocA family oxidoreductase [Limnochordia bacterium]